jgi:hypothetical protein
MATSTIQSVDFVPLSEPREAGVIGLWRDLEETEDRLTNRAGKDYLADFGSDLAVRNHASDQGPVGR